MNDAAIVRVDREFIPAAGMLGLALGGFFDGILLHQVLQWHHLLSAVEGPAFADIRVQILADGLFHALMYVIAAVGLLRLWARRQSLVVPGAGRRLAASALLGFGAWHVLDGVLSHWLLGIHRIRMDVPNPLLWDLIWFVGFGVVFLALGWYLLRSRDGARRSGGGNAAAWLLAAGTVVAAAMAARPVADADAVMVLFGAGIAPAQAVTAIDAAGGRILWANRAGDLWAVKLGHASDARILYRQGALLVGNSPLIAGCLAWSRPASR